MRKMSSIPFIKKNSPAEKQMIRLSAEYWQDSKILIRLWKSLAENTAKTDIAPVYS